MRSSLHMNKQTAEAKVSKNINIAITETRKLLSRFFPWKCSKVTRLFAVCKIHSFYLKPLQPRVIIAMNDRDHDLKLLATYVIHVHNETRDIVYWNYTEGLGCLTITKLHGVVQNIALHKKPI